MLEIANFSIELLSLLFITAIVAGCIDTLAGGGGLITIPALILSGIPMLSVLGTNKLQGSMGTANATLFMLKKKKIMWPEIKALMLFAFLGSLLGTIAVQFIETQVLSLVIPLVLLLITVYFLLSPLLKPKQGLSKLSDRSYKTKLIPFIGFYDGMFGPGTGSFFALAGVSVKGHDLVCATALAKPLNFATNIASLIVFIAAGHVVWVIGLVMVVGQFIGSWLGSHALFKINPAYLRWVVVLMCTSMLVKYCYSVGWL